ncbi:hypothetical protein [Marinobacterium aestuariivivens]|uniref:Dihydroorotate dehydrogenase catalytic domain-containing protein n=1 Tax=Marinobacterium aestuariivivens TaxID=1698799 RepID=A0ABW1ZUJ6_9GAMM
MARSDRRERLGSRRRARCGAGPVRAPRQVMGLSFANPLGIAAGIDPVGALSRCAGAMGFGALEIGTLTPRPEPGHNPGVGVLRALRQHPAGLAPVRLGINLGLNRNTPPERALMDFRDGLRAAWPYADYIALNFSSAQTRVLLDPDHRHRLLALLSALKREQYRLTRPGKRPVPLALKLSLATALCESLLTDLCRLRLDALILVQESAVPEASEPAWRLLARRQRACAELRRLKTRLAGRLQVIAVGGIGSARDAADRLRAGADLVQVHRALLPGGPLHGRRPDWRWHLHRRAARRQVIRGPGQYRFNMNPPFGSTTPIYGD